MYNDVCVSGFRRFAVSFHDSVNRVKVSVQLVLREIEVHWGIKKEKFTMVTMTVIQTAKWKPIMIMISPMMLVNNH